MSANPALDRDEIELFIVDAGEVVAAEPAVEAMEEEPSLFTNVERAVEEAAPSDVELVDRSAAVDALSADAPRADATADALSRGAPAREAEEAPLVTGTAARPSGRPRPRPTRASRTSGSIWSSSSSSRSSAAT